MQVKSNIYSEIVFFFEIKKTFAAKVLQSSGNLKNSENLSSSRTNYLRMPSVHSIVTLCNTRIFYRICITKTISIFLTTNTRLKKIQSKGKNNFK